MRPSDRIHIDACQCYIIKFPVFGPGDRDNLNITIHDDSLYLTTGLPERPTETRKPGPSTVTVTLAARASGFGSSESEPSSSPAWNLNRGLTQGKVNLAAEARPAEAAAAAAAQAGTGRGTQAASEHGQPELPGRC